MPPPPRPGPFVRPNISVIMEALRDVTFPISKRDIMDGLSEEDTIVMGGRNVELRLLVRDLNDDHFESADEFREALELTYGDRTEPRVEAMILPMPPTGFPEDMPMGAPGREDQPGLPEDNA
jgi:hypothetical protein